MIYEVKTCTSHTWKLPIWNYHHFMCLWECTLVMCFFKLSSSVHEFHKPLIWMVSSQHELFLHVISKVREGISSPSMKLTLPLLTHENYTFEITLMLCASENALCVNVSSNDLEEHITRVHSEAHNMMIMSNVCEVQVLINFTDDDASFSNFWNIMQNSSHEDFNHSNARFLKNHILNKIICRNT